MTIDFSKVHPQLQTLAKNNPKITLTRWNLGLIRALMYFLLRPKVPNDVVVENIFIPSADPKKQIRLRLYTPAYVTSSLPVLIWLHGGGYVMGRPEMDAHLCAEYVRSGRVSVDYRYAPQHPFPAGLEDSYTALKWVVAQGKTRPFDPQRLAVGGASAGGGLAAALAQFAHDQQEINLALQLLVYPMLDDRTSLRSDLPADASYITWGTKNNRFGWEAYLQKPCGAEDVPPYAVPARRSNLSGLPPAWVGVGSLDLFYDENVAYAQKLQEQGVECQLYTVPGAFHGFDVFDQQIPVVKQFQEAQIEALKKYLWR
jgi:acetyl esterase/lipase